MDALQPANLAVRFLLQLCPPGPAGGLVRGPGRARSPRSPSALARPSRCRGIDVRRGDDSIGRKENTSVNQGSALLLLGPPRPPILATIGRSSPAKALLRAVWWAREELNLRPLPCQQNPGNRCARRRSRRSAPTVDAEGKRSPDVQLNALFRHFDAAAAARVAHLRHSRVIVGGHPPPLSFVTAGLATEGMPP
jgi:hypothetical protein